MKNAEQVKQEAIENCEKVIQEILNSRDDVSTIPGFWIHAIKMCEERIKKINLEDN
jgi:hypothetical protein